VIYLLDTSESKKGFRLHIKKHIVSHRVIDEWNALSEKNSPEQLLLF